MSELELNELIFKYKYRAYSILGGFLLLAIVTSWYITPNAYELLREVDKTSIFTGIELMWWFIAIGFFVVLYISLSTVESIINDLVKRGTE